MIYLQKVKYDREKNIYKYVDKSKLISIDSDNIEDVPNNYCPFVCDKSQLFCLDIDVKGAKHRGFSQTTSNYETIINLLQFQSLQDHYAEDTRSLGVHILFYVPDELDALARQIRTSFIELPNHAMTVECFYKTDRLIYSTNCTEFKHIKPINSIDTFVKSITREELELIRDTLNRLRKEPVSIEKNNSYKPVMSNYTQKDVKVILDAYIQLIKQQGCNAIYTTLGYSSYCEFWVTIGLAIYNTNANWYDLFAYFSANIPVNEDDTDEYNERNTQQVWKRWELKAYNDNRISWKTIENDYIYHFCANNIIDSIPTQEDIPTQEEDNYLQKILNIDSLFGKIARFLYKKHHNYEFSILTAISCMSYIAQYTYQFCNCDNSLQLNTYIVLLAPTGSGKDFYIKFAQRFAEFMRIELLDNPSSRQGLLRQLGANVKKDYALILDEFNLHAQFLGNTPTSDIKFTASIQQLFNSNQESGSATKKKEDSFSAVKGAILSIFGVGVANNVQKWAWECGLNRIITYITDTVQRKQEDFFDKGIIKQEDYEIAEFINSISDEAMQLKTNNDSSFWVSITINDEWIQDKDKWDNEQIALKQKNNKHEIAEFKPDCAKYSSYNPISLYFANNDYNIRQELNKYNIPYNGEHTVSKAHVINDYIKQNYRVEKQREKYIIRENMHIDVLLCLAYLGKDILFENKELFYKFMKHINLSLTNHCLNIADINTLDKQDLQSNYVKFKYKLKNYKSDEITNRDFLRYITMLNSTMSKQYLDMFLNEEILIETTSERKNSKKYKINKESIIE